LTNKLARLLLVGGTGPTDVANHLWTAANALGYETRIIDASAAYRAPYPLAKFNWIARGRRPTHLVSFSQQLTQEVDHWKPAVVIATGFVALTLTDLTHIQKSGIPVIVFLSDDPWNRDHHPPWFIQVLPFFDCVFTPRMDNVDDLRAAQCRRVEYLPFAYSPEIHFIEESPMEGERERLSSDVVIVGGADAERVALLQPLLRTGLKVHLYGGYWHRFRSTRRFSRGHAEPGLVRKAIRSSKVSPCLVRRANRDGHAMRTYEVPAMGGCPLVEDTAEHRTLFGEEGEAVLYFSDGEELARKARSLVVDEPFRKRLRDNSHRLITQGANTYADRLASFLEAVGV
jgi:spore maturation protein CgeB